MNCELKWQKEQPAFCIGRSCCGIFAGKDTRPGQDCPVAYKVCKDKEYSFLSRYVVGILL